MTSSVTITTPSGQLAPIGISASAEKRARVTFNPSGNERVLRLKLLTAALYTELEAIAPEGERSHRAREAASAATQLQFAAMMAVSAATAE